jgi:dTMP kinase
MDKGKLISIEGVEGAGKSTVLQFIKIYLTKLNKKIVWTREPGGTELAEQIRHLILCPTHAETIEAETELLLMFAGRVQHMKKIILPALEAGQWVITDRFIDASYAYQGGGRKIPIQYIQLLDQWIVGSVYPNLTLLLDIAPEQGFSRTEKRTAGKDRIEQEKMDFFNRVRQVYLERAQQDSERIKIIDASQPLAIVERQISHVLDSFVDETG